MVNVDEQTRYAIELVAESVKLTNQLLIFIMEKAIEMLEGKDKDDILINDSTKTGKQKIEELMKKYGENVEVLDENITKQQLQDYKKELKKLGVDFSVVKSGKDSYSFFFASQQGNIIEKALKNVLERKMELENNEKVKNANLELNSAKSKLTNEQIGKVKNIYDKISSNPKLTVDDEKKLIKKNNLSPEEKTLLDKFKNLDNVIQDVNNYIDNKEKQKQPILSKDESKKMLKEKLSELNEKELALFIQKMEYENLATSPNFNPELTYREANKLTKMKKNFSKDQVKKINDLDKEFRNISNVDKRGLTPKEILIETKNYLKEHQNKYSLNNVKKIDLEIQKEREAREYMNNFLDIVYQEIYEEERNMKKNKERDRDNDGISDRIDIDDNRNSVQTVSDLSLVNNSINKETERYNKQKQELER